MTRPTQARVWQRSGASERPARTAHAVLACAVALPLLLPGASLASEAWEIDPATVATYVDVEDARLIVVGCGEQSEELDRIVESLRDALRSSTTARPVTDLADLGRVHDLADLEVVETAAGLPVDRVVIVRFFPGSEPAGDTAVATFYDPRGAVRAAFTLTHTQRLLPYEAPAAADAPGSDDSGWERESDSRGVSPDAVSAVAEALRGDRREMSPEAEYERKRLWFGAPDGSGDVDVPRWSRCYQGPYRRKVGDDAFYEIIGRDDLLDRYERNHRAKVVLLLAGPGVGAPLFFIGLGIAADANASRGDWLLGDTSEPDPETAQDGAVLMVIGGSVWGTLQLVGALANPHPISATEARELADEYNQHLRAELKPGAELQNVEWPAKRRPWLTIRLALGATGIGLTGRF